VIVELATRHLAWGHRKIWAMARHNGHGISQRSVARILDAERLLLKADYQRERRELAKARQAAFAAPTTDPYQLWQLDFSEYETAARGTWWVADVADYRSECEFGWHWSPTANRHDAVAAVEMVIVEAQRLLGERPLVEHLTDPYTGEIVPITLVTDNGGPFRSFGFGAFITAHLKLRHVRTRVRSPGRNGVRERASGSLKYERLYHEQIGDALGLVREAEEFPVEFNEVRPHEALALNRPLDAHLR
jgi:putative transposase